ncbi:uncharacterized protein LOC114871488 [Osmia bicornis bicornis]|uniref:uncharacterized protein LOC114871488 n=1 Tax=Osmia bicornis bicornis TaxID=1437191 RepID=UPI0010F98413|nr:uncharacterized protein LOC114871488 [Osmia bicornis bicornis]
MEVEEYVSYEFQGILEEFGRIRDAYVALKAYCKIQDETMTMEKERSERMRENLEKLSRTYLLLEKRCKSTIVALQTEKEGLLKTIEDLKEQCDHLRLINTDRNANDERTYQLQDEIEILKAQLSMQEEKHNEDIALLKQKHSDEIQRYKMLLQNTKQNTARPKNLVKSKNNTSCFRWPELNIERHKSNLMDIENESTGSKSQRNKKRKLFSEDRTATFDIV